MGTGMDAGAALLVNRTDCESDSELNFDALLLGGYFCHRCLPEEYMTCDMGGVCSNVQWSGYTCDNEFFVTKNATGGLELQNANGTSLEPSAMELKSDVTYRINVLGNFSLCASLRDKVECAQRGPLLFAVEDGEKATVSFALEGEEEPKFELGVSKRSTENDSAAFKVVGWVIISG